MANIAVVGTGYVGSVTGACLAKEGHEVMLVDNVPEKVDMIMAGRAPTSEPELDEIISGCVSEGSLRATTNLARAVSSASVVLLSLPTPSADDGSAELKYVFGVADELGELIREDAIVATRSTVPVGTTERVRERIAAKTRLPFFAVSNPEFLAEGSAVEDTLKPSRIVVGTDSAEAASRMREVWHPFVLDNPDKLLVMGIRDAEMSKLAANVQLAGQISLSNVIAEICEQVGADYREIRRAISLDHRIGSFTYAGPGYGGSCFPKDVRSLSHIGKEYGVDTAVLDLVTETNERMKQRLFTKVNNYFDGNLADKKIGVLGISFKPNTDDIRESPSLTLIDDLLAAGAAVTAYDPEAMDNARQYFGDKPVALANDKYAAARGADALVIVTDWGRFKSLDFEHLGSIMNHKVLFDARSLYDPQNPRQHGFYYDSIGRPIVQPGAPISNE